MDLTSLIFTTDGSDWDANDGSDRYTTDDNGDDGYYYEPTDDLTDSQDNKKNGHAADTGTNSTDDGEVRQLEEFSQSKMDEFVVSYQLFV